MGKKSIPVLVVEARLEGIDLHSSLGCQVEDVVVSKDLNARVQESAHNATKRIQN